MNNKSLLGLDERVVAALSYLFGSISGIIVLVLERDNKYVRFHALQSTLWFLLLMVATWLLNIVIGIVGVIPIIGQILGMPFSLVLSIGGLVYFLSKICLIFMACTGKTFKIPILGDVAWNQVYK